MSTELIELSDSGGNLTPPVSVYNTSLASEIVTISGLPFGIGAVIANILLIVCKCGWSRNRLDQVNNQSELVI